MASVYNAIKAVLDVKDLAVRDINVITDENDDPLALQVLVRQHKSSRNRCPVCNNICPKYDSGRRELHRWRALDWNGLKVYIECFLPRVECKDHGVRTAGVSWAFHKSRFTKDFEHFVAYLVGDLSKTKIANFLGLGWRTVGACVERVHNDLEPDVKVRYNKLINIGIDETSYKKGHKYFVLVVDHVRPRVVWIKEGRSESILNTFFEDLTEEQRSSIKLVTADGADWITKSVEKYLPNATRCIDHFHVAQWMVEAIDAIRNEEVRAAREEILKISLDIQNAESPEEAKELRAKLKEAKSNTRTLKRSKYALGKGKENLTVNQSDRLRIVLAKSKKLNRAHELKELLRLILRFTDVTDAKNELKKWIFRASHSRMEPIKDLAKKIKKHMQQILDTLRHGISNARVEGINAKIKLLIRTGFGFRNTENLKALILLKCSDLEPRLPHRKRRQLLVA